MSMLDVSTRIAIKNVLYATDFSEASTAALPYVLDIARLYGSRVVAVHVINPSHVDPELESIGAQAGEREAQQHMNSLRRHLRGIPHQLMLLKGDVCSALEKTIEEENADLFVVGTHGRTGREKLLLGSVAEKMFRQATCPVLTVGPRVKGHRLATRSKDSDSTDAKFNSIIKRILYATDFTPESLGAAPFAISLAQEHQALLLMLHVIETQTLSPHQSARDVIPDLEKLIPPERELWRKPEFFVEFGRPAQKIIDMAEGLRADLIILGVRKAQGQLFASTHLPVTTAHKVVVNAMCPVLTVLE